MVRFSILHGRKGFPLLIERSIAVRVLTEITMMVIIKMVMVMGMEGAIMI
jgi:hypothetical protein